MKELGYGRNYRYAHNEPDRVADMDCLPPNRRRVGATIEPSGEGFERDVRTRLESLERVRKATAANERGRRRAVERHAPDPPVEPTRHRLLIASLR